MSAVAGGGPAATPDGGPRGDGSDGAEAPSVTSSVTPATAPATATATATSEDGRFVLFDADLAEPPPDEAPFEPWLEASVADELALPWTGRPGRRRLHVAVGVTSEAALPAAPDRVRTADEPAARGTLELPSGRLCVAGLDEAFAARNAELHPGAFGEVIELEPGRYDVEVRPLEWIVPPEERERVRRSVLRRGDEAIAGLVHGGLPLLLVLAAFGAAAVTGVLALGGTGAGPAVVWTVGVAAVLLTAWAAIVQAGASPPLRRVLAARRRVAEAFPDAVLAVRRVGPARDAEAAAAADQRALGSVAPAPEAVATPSGGAA